MRCKVVKAFGQIFFKEMEMSEIETNIDKIMIKETGVHNEQ